MASPLNPAYLAFSRSLLNVGEIGACKYEDGDARNNILYNNIRHSLPGFRIFPKLSPCEKNLKQPICP